MKIKNSTYLIFLSLFFFLCSNVWSQEVKAFAQLDTQKIRIGEQAKLTIFLSYPNELKSKIDWPDFEDTIIKQVEIISISKLKTSIPQKNQNNLIQQELELTITSFDSGYWAIPPFVFLVDKDSSKKIETQALLLEVNTVAVDTAETSIKDIKPPFEDPLSWKDYIPEIGIVLGILAVLIIAFILYKKLKKKKPIESKPKLKIAAHLLALQELESIKNKNLWQEGKLKEYYTSITDTLRTYLENRFGIHAMELTSDEIMQVMKSQVIDKISKEKLESVLKLADFVKFAKANPIDVENEMTMSQAIDFIKGTLREEVSVDENNTNNIT